MYVHAPYAYIALRGQKNTLKLWKLETEVVASHHVGFGNQTQVFCKNSQCS